LFELFSIYKPLVYITSVEKGSVVWPRATLIKIKKNSIAAAKNEDASSRAQLHRSDQLA